ncbi:MAG: DUF1616 domain-containing protein [Candidatus Lokiarchaeota archaeon]|nr:DUF1616 domain-containing protein [Candidatus Lokiarchaeota archaeon]
MESNDISKKDFKLYFIVIIIVIVITSSLVIYNVIINVEKSTSFYWYDENGGYNFPKEIQVNHYYNVTIGISNFEQKLMLYRVYVKVGNISTIINSTHPADLYINSTFFEFTVLNGLTKTFDVSMNMTIVQINIKLVTELWKYDSVSNTYVYSGKFLFVHYNVTA